MQPQSTTEGNGDGDAGDDNNSWTVTTTDGGGGTLRYRSVGTTATDLNTTPRTVEISGTTATFSGAMPDNVGVGDVLTYNTGSNQLAFIAGRTSSSEYTVADKDGGTPAAASAGTAVGVYRAYTSMSSWEASTENGNITEPTENDVNPSTDLVSAKHSHDGRRLRRWSRHHERGPSTAGPPDPSNYIKIYTPVTSSEVGISQRHSGVWDTSKYHIDASGKVFEVEEEYVRIEGLQIRQTSVGQGTATAASSSRMQLAPASTTSAITLFGVSPAAATGTLA